MASRSGIFVVVLEMLCITCCGGSGEDATQPSTPTAAPPTFSPAPRAFSGAQSVTLADTTAGASIDCTTNGATPTGASPVYSASTPIAVSSTTTIQPIAIAPGYWNSAVASGAYTSAQTVMHAHRDREQPDGSGYERRRVSRIQGSEKAA
jgi:hypothetical protein